MRQTIILKDTNKISFSGEKIFKASIGPYKYITTGQDFDITGRLVECLMWCSKDGEPIKTVDAEKYDIQYLATTNKGD